jgi:hypothetical protein
MLFSISFAEMAEGPDVSGRSVPSTPAEPFASLRLLDRLPDQGHARTELTKSTKARSGAGR